MGKGSSVRKLTKTLASFLLVFLFTPQAFAADIKVDDSGVAIIDGQKTDVAALKFLETIFGNVISVALASYQVSITLFLEVKSNSGRGGILQE